jgi:hypothetical protein
MPAKHWFVCAACAQQRRWDKTVFCLLCCDPNMWHVASVGCAVFRTAAIHLEALSRQSGCVWWACFVLVCGVCCMCAQCVGVFGWQSCFNSRPGGTVRDHALVWCWIECQLYGAWLLNLPTAQCCAHACPHHGVGDVSSSLVVLSLFLLQRKHWRVRSGPRWLAPQGEWLLSSRVVCISHSRLLFSGA